MSSLSEVSEATMLEIHCTCGGCDRHDGRCTQTFQARPSAESLQFIQGRCASCVKVSVYATNAPTHESCPGNANPRVQFIGEWASADTKGKLALCCGTIADKAVVWIRDGQEVDQGVNRVCASSVIEVAVRVKTLESLGPAIAKRKYGFFEKLPPEVQDLLVRCVLEGVAAAEGTELGRDKSFNQPSLLVQLDTGRIKECKDVGHQFYQAPHQDQAVGDAQCVFAMTSHPATEVLDLPHLTEEDAEKFLGLTNEAAKAQVKNDGWYQGHRNLLRELRDVDGKMTSSTASGLFVAGQGIVMDGSVLHRGPMEPPKGYSEPRLVLFVAATPKTRTVPYDPDEQWPLPIFLVRLAERMEDQGTRILIREKAVECFAQYLDAGYRLQDHVRDDMTSYKALMKLVDAKAASDAAKVGMDAAKVEAAKGLGAKDEDTVTQDEDTHAPRPTLRKKAAKRLRKVESS